MGETDARRLQNSLDEVTRIKLEALRELTAESMGDERMFMVFLTQCDNLSRKIQAKIALYSTEEGDKPGSKSETKG